MSIISYSSPKTNEPDKNDSIIIKKPLERKVLEEEEYLDCMSKIIRRDFFPGIELHSNEDHPSSCRSTSTNITDNTYLNTPATDRTNISTTSSVITRKRACSFKLNKFLDKYTSEDNAYFEKLQKKELKKHREKYPWIYKETSTHNKSVKNQLKLPSNQDKAIEGNQTKMIDWKHNPKNSLFYAPKDTDECSSKHTTINYNLIRRFNKPLFKEPSTLQRSIPKLKGFNGFTDKIGIDGKLLNGSETPIIQGYAYIPQPEIQTSKISDQPRILKSDMDRFHIPDETPRDELAHRIYQEKVAKSIRTPKTTGTLSNQTPLSSLRTPSSMRKSYADFTFSPERIKTPKKR